MAPGPTESHLISLFPETIKKKKLFKKQFLAISRSAASWKNISRYNLELASVGNFLETDVSYAKKLIDLKEFFSSRVDIYSFINISQEMKGIFFQIHDINKKKHCILTNDY